MFDLESIQKEIEKEGADGWLIVDYENKNKTLVSFLGEKMLTRKIFLYFPKSGKPQIICHKIDTAFLKDEETKRNFDLNVYLSWQEMLEIEKTILKSARILLMDISEFGLLPRVSLADYGSVMYVKSLGIDVKSSADLLQHFSALYGERSLSLQKEACRKALMIKDEAFKKIRDDILSKGESDEYEIQKFIANRFIEEGMVYDDMPIVAVNANASDPHYGPSENVSSPIKQGDVVLIDMWAKMNDKDAVYADITWMGYVGETLPEEVKKRFAVLRKAIEKGFSFLETELPKRRVEGYEVDKVVHQSIIDDGYGDGIVHRTGHNIAVDISPHGPGVNIDDLESHDTREIIDGVTFSLEPGIYLKDFGMRSETDVRIENRKPIYMAGHQLEVIPILKK